MTSFPPDRGSLRDSAEPRGKDEPPSLRRADSCLRPISLLEILERHLA